MSDTQSGSFFARARAALARAIAGDKGNAPRARSAFAGAAMSRLNADWIFSGTRSANQDTLGELRTLRNRSRDLVRNSPFLRRYHELLADNVVGPHGIQLQAKNLTLKGELFTSANDLIEENWRTWTRAENCDVAGRMSLTDMLRLAVSSGWGADGELLIRIREGAQPNRWNFSLQLLDPDLLDETLNRAASKNDNAIVQGVEVNVYGAPVAYWLWTRHPAEAAYDRERVRVPAREIIHDFIPLRPGQTRGIPWAAAVINELKMLEGYKEAELVAARIASATMASIEIPDPEKAPGFDPAAGSTDMPMEIEPGALLRLNPGETLKSWSADHPSQAFGDFMRVSLHSIAAGLGISYGTLTGDLSQANYSSMRVGMLAERDHWRALQQRLIDRVVDPIFRRWLSMAMLAGKMTLLGSDPDRWTTVRWQPRGFDWIDPLKDIQGDVTEVAAGVKTLTEIAASRGRDFEEVVEERRRELDLLAQYGVTSQLAPSGSPPAADSSNNSPANDKEAVA